MPRFSCPLLSEEEYSAVCVPFASLESSIHQVMEEHGFCIIPDLLPIKEAKELESLLSQELISLVDENKVDQMSQKVQDVYRVAKEQGIGEWPKESLQNCCSNEEGYMCKRGLAHSNFSWECRFRAKKVFEVLHGTKDLVSGFDTIMASNNRELPSANNSCWPHIDRADSDTSVPGLADWEVYQSILYLWSSEGSGATTTVVWPGSHKPEIYDYYRNDPVSRRLGENGIHFNQLLALRDPVSREAMYQGWLKNSRRVQVPAGGLIVWSSRVTHQGWSGGPRLAQPICWEPRSRRSEQARQRKVMLAALGLPSTHWASLGQMHGHRLFPTPFGGSEFRGDTSTIGFPLRASINCRSLKDGVNPVEVWDKFLVPDLFSGNVVPSHKDLPMLEGLLKDEILGVL